MGNPRPASGGFGRSIASATRKDRPRTAGLESALADAHARFCSGLLKQLTALVQRVLGSKTPELGRTAARCSKGDQLHVVWRWADEPTWRERCVKGLVVSKRRESLTVDYERLGLLPFPPIDSRVIIIFAERRPPKSTARPHRLLKSASRTANRQTDLGKSVSAPVDFDTLAVKSHRGLTVGSLNCTTLRLTNRDKTSHHCTSPEVQELVFLMKSKKIDVLAVQEHRFVFPDNEAESWEHKFNSGVRTTSTAS